MRCATPSPLCSWIKRTPKALKASWPLDSREQSHRWLYPHRHQTLARKLNQMTLKPQPEAPDHPASRHGLTHRDATGTLPGRTTDPQRPTSPSQPTDEQAPRPGTLGTLGTLKSLTLRTHTTTHEREQPYLPPCFLPGFRPFGSHLVQQERKPVLTVAILFFLTVGLITLRVHKAV